MKRIVVLSDSHRSIGGCLDILENIIKNQEQTQKLTTIETFITIRKNSFAEFMHIKDILWPANFFLLSILPSKSRQVQIDQQGDNSLHEGDVLHIRYATFDEPYTKKALTDIVGEQDYDETSVVNE